MCEMRGVLVDEGIRQCLTDACKVQLYWKGGFAQRGGTVGNDLRFEEELHSNKEEILDKSLKRKVHSLREEKMSQVLKNFSKEDLKNLSLKRKLHSDKEREMSDIVKRKLHSKREKNMSNIVKRYRKKS